MTMNVQISFSLGLQPLALEIMFIVFPNYVLRVVDNLLCAAAKRLIPSPQTASNELQV